MLGWAALRLLPATLVVIVLLSWLNIRGAGSEEAVEVDPTGAVLTWILDPPTETESGS